MLVPLHADTIEYHVASGVAFTRGWIGPGMRAFTCLPNDLTDDVARHIRADGHVDVLVDPRLAYVYGVN